MNGLHRDLLGHCPTYKTQCFTLVPSYAAVTFKHAGVLYSEGPIHWLSIPVTFPWDLKKFYML